MGTLDSIQAKELARRASGGDKEAFAKLYAAYSPAIFGVLCKILRSEELAKDSLQDSFVKIWKNLPSYDPKKGTVFTWMLNIARNGAIDKWRSISRKRPHEIQTPADVVGMTTPADPTMNTDAIGLKDLVNDLKPELRQMVEYIYFSGFTQQEVADELEMPLGTVKTRIRAAVIALRSHFNKE